MANDSAAVHLQLEPFNGQPFGEGAWDGLKLNLGIKIGIVKFIVWVLYFITLWDFI
jgi:hypothetical protein